MPVIFRAAPCRSTGPGSGKASRSASSERAEKTNGLSILDVVKWLLVIASLACPAKAWQGMGYSNLSESAWPQLGCRGNGEGREEGLGDSPECAVQCAVRERRKAFFGQRQLWRVGEHQ